MRLDEYKEMVDKMSIPEDMDYRLKKALFTDQKEKKRMKNKKLMKEISVAAAVAVLVLGVSQTTLISNATEAITHFFKYGFTFTEKDGEQITVDMKMNYLTLDENAPKENQYMDSLEEVSDAIGIRLLNSPEEYVSDGSVEYCPSVSEDQILKGVTIRNHFYAIGEKYQTPIGTQISVRTDENLTSQYQDNELGFASENADISLDNKNAEAEVYQLSNLNVKAVLYTVQTDGPVKWGIEEGEIDVTYAVFVHEGVEYVYYGGVSHDIMKKFLDTLE